MAASARVAVRQAAPLFIFYTRRSGLEGGIAPGRSSSSILEIGFKLPAHPSAIEVDVFLPLLVATGDQCPYRTSVMMTRSTRTPPRASEPPYVQAWSAVDNVVSEAGPLSNKAQKEISKASSAAQAKTGQIEVDSAKHYAACTFGRLLACAQRAFKYGGYDFFKKFYSDLAGKDAAYRYKTGLCLGASASAELIAEVALRPFEALKVGMQTTVFPFASGTFGGISALLVRMGPLGKPQPIRSGRQIPYTMMKFASFETIVEAIYGQKPKSKSEYRKGVRTGVFFAGGYLPEYNILCTIVSYAADVVVSKLNANRQPREAFGGAMSRIYKDIEFGSLWNGLCDLCTYG
ncbi:MAG: hypothetical protein Q9172_003322 [Xanthocarpia lactea]